MTKNRAPFSSKTPVQVVPCTSVVDGLGPLLKGSIEEHLYLTLTLAGGGQAGVDSDAILRVWLRVRLPGTVLINVMEI